MQKVTRREFSNLMLLSIALFKTPVGAQTVTGDEAAIRQAEQRLVVASLDGKWEEADRLVSPDYIQVDPHGSIQRKGDLVTAIKEWSKFPVEIRPHPEVVQSDVIIRLLGDTALVVAKVTSKQGYASFEDYVKKRQPKEINHESRFTHVWVRIENRWQLISSHRSNIGEKCG